jgi:Fic family protein
VPPPDLDKIVQTLQSEGSEKISKVFNLAVTGESIARQKYVPWDKLRYLTPPDGLTHEEWWLVTKLARRSVRRTLPIVDKNGNEFAFALPDEVLRAIESVNRMASGSISISEQVTNPVTRDRYLVNSLIEEAITSSQLEIVTEGTLDNPDASGRFQAHDEQRVTIQDNYGEILHVPPPASELPERVQRLCDFANQENEKAEAYIPPVLRAITIHFMIGYDHPFEDGNGRTARALFYWSMLHEGYWLTEFLTISKILKNAPAKYARSFLYTEQDANDLTYFHIYQLDVFLRAVKGLHEYLAVKMNELRNLQKSLKTIPGEFNHRQVALLKNAMTHPGQRYTAVSHSRSHEVTTETARQDLAQLEKRKLLVRGKIGKAFFWTPANNLLEILDGNES